MATAESIVPRDAPSAQRAALVPLELPQPEPRVPAIPLVRLCYTLVHAAEAAGIRDLADGEYRAEDTSFEQGMRRQLNELLERVGCLRPGFRLLEIGCGYGSLLAEAKLRGARAVGVNVSPEQVEYCHSQGLQAYCCNYRDLLTAPAWHGQFDGVIANGSLEHWVQPEDVLAGRMDDIYRESFAIAARVLDPAAPEARYVTTAIHVKREVHPEQLLTPWHRHPRGSNARHYSLLHHWMGGYYPVDGQLAHCAEPYFELELETDGTAGYKQANDYRLARMQRALFTNPRVVGRIARAFVRHPWVTGTMIESFFVEQSWDWQFRGADPPMKLLRHTWRRTRIPG